MMNKFLGKISNIAGWLVIVVSIFLYLAVSFLVFEIPEDKTIFEIIFNYKTIVNTILVIFLNISIKLSTQSVSLQYVMAQKEFTLTNKTNNDIINDAINSFKDLSQFVLKHNQEQLAFSRKAYLFDLGKETYDELNKKQKKVYDKKTKYDKISLTGFIRPILSLSKGKNNKTEYDVNYDTSKEKAKGVVAHTFSGLLLASFTVNMGFNIADNPMEIMIQFLIVMFGLIINFIMTFVPIIFRFLQVKPNIVEDKRNLYNNFKQIKDFIPNYVDEYIESERKKGDNKEAKV